MAPGFPAFHGIAARRRSAEATGTGSGRRPRTGRRPGGALPSPSGGPTPAHRAGSDSPGNAAFETKGDDVLLTPIHSSGDDQHQELELQSVHGPERTPVRMSDVGREQRPCQLPRFRNCSRFCSADFSRRTGSALIAGESSLADECRTRPKQLAESPAHCCADPAE